MLAELFLAAALAAPSAFTHKPIEPPKQMGEIQKLRHFVRSRIPDAEIVITPKHQPRTREWERLPFLWEDRAVWVKRPDAKRAIIAALPVLATLEGFVRGKTELFAFLINYRQLLAQSGAPARVLVMGFREDAFPMLNFFQYGGFSPFGIAHFPFPATDKPYIRGEYDAMPYRDSSFSMVFAPDLHVWHVQDNQFLMINDTRMAFEVARITAMGGFFMADMRELQGFALHLVHAGFEKMDHVFGNIEVWQKTSIPRPDDMDMSVMEWVLRHHKSVVNRVGLNVGSRKHRGRKPIKSAA